MRILLLSASYHPNLGGLQTVTHNLAQHLVAQGHEVRVVTNRYPRSLPSRETSDGVPVERLLFLWPEPGYLHQRRVDLFLASWLYAPATLLRLLYLCKKFRPDVVNVHFPDAQIPFVLWLRRLFHFRLVVSLHGDEVLRWMKDGRRKTGDQGGRMMEPQGLRRLRTILREADAVTACSGWLLNKAIALEPSVAAKGRAIHNGVDLERFNDRTTYIHPRSYILAYGRMTHKKGFDMLIDAFAKVDALPSNLDLILAGTGEEAESLQKQARKLGLADRVHFFGRATPEQVIHLLNGCYFVVIPSREEPFGIVALESLAAGKPVLATHVGGLPEILSPLDGRGAALFEPTIEGIIQGLRRWLGCQDELSKWREETREHASQFTWERMVQSYQHAFGCDHSS